MKAFAHCSLAGAVERIPPGSKVLLPPGCGEPASLVAEICRQADRVAPLTFMGGVHLGGYPFCRPEHAGKLAYATWQMSPALRDAADRGQTEFVPARYFDLTSVFVDGGPWAPDCVLVQTAPPDAHGYLSLGVSVSIALPAARRAPLVIAQVNPRMPRTLGHAFLHRSEIDAWVDVDEDLLAYPPPAVGDVERAIGRHVAALVEDGATIQVGIGAIPQAVLEALDGKRDLGLHSLLVDAAVGLCERGVVTNARKPVHRGRMDIGEVMGTRRVFDFVRENPAVHMESADFTHDPHLIAAMPDFVAINSALEIDLTGQVTAETVGGRQVAGIGGQFDFVLGASRSRRGAAIIALPSTGRGGAVSRIVRRLSTGAAVTTPRYVADWVVTEHGAAHLKGRGEKERAAALIAVAHPAFAEELARATS